VSIPKLENGFLWLNCIAATILLLLMSALRLELHVSRPTKTTQLLNMLALLEHQLDSQAKLGCTKPSDLWKLILQVQLNSVKAVLSPKACWHNPIHGLQSGFTQ
jgi:hypothetical protein